MTFHQNGNALQTYTAAEEEQINFLLISVSGTLLCQRLCLEPVPVQQ